MAAGRLPSAQPPTDTLPVVRVDRDCRRSLDLFRWALVPWWAKDIKIGARCINAMAETVAMKPALRDAFARGQRCIVPVDAFYECKQTPGGKQGYAIVGADGLPVAMASLWEWQHRPDLHNHDDHPQRALWVPFMIVCPSSCRGRNGPPGLVSTRLILTSCGG